MHRPPDEAVIDCQPSQQAQAEDAVLPGLGPAAPSAFARLIRCKVIWSGTFVADVGNFLAQVPCLVARALAAQCRASGGASGFPTLFEWHPISVLRRELA